jgi:hypothetical protein
MCKFSISATVQFMEVEGSDDESLESDDPVQFMEVEGTDHESVESDDPDVQQRAAQAFNVVCEELGDLIMARLPVRDLLRTRSVCKYLRACSLQLNSKYFRRRQLEAGVTDWYFPTSGVGGAKSVTSGLEMGAWMGLHQPSSGVLSLPPFTFLPFSLESMVMVAASGGLVCSKSYLLTQSSIQQLTSAHTELFFRRPSRTELTISSSAIL